MVDYSYAIKKSHDDSFMNDLTEITYKWALQRVRQRQSRKPVLLTLVSLVTLLTATLVFLRH